MRDFIETRLDVALDNPLVGAGGEMAHLGHRVVDPMVRAEPIRTRQKIRFEDRFQHQFQGCLHHLVGNGGDSQPPQLTVRLGNHPFPDRERAEAAVLQRDPQPFEEVLDTLHGLDRVGGVTVHSSRAGSLVSPHPGPCNQQERRVNNEVEQIIKPAMRSLAGPTVQLRLDLQYPAFRPDQGALQLVGIHRRVPPGLPVLPPRTCCPPSPCARLSRARTTTGTPPRTDAPGRRRTCPPPGWPPGRTGDI